MGTEGTSHVPQAMTILNVGCGTKTSSDPRVVNMDFSMYLVIKSTPLLARASRLFLSKQRLERLHRLPESILVHDFRKGIPFPDRSVDAVYHSHFLEHLDPPSARRFLVETKRALKAGGIQRIAVPDLEKLCTSYTAHVQACLTDPKEIPAHDSYVATMIEQMVRREAFGTAQQTPMRRKIERLIQGDARRQGQTHQWMYDRINLPHLLKEVGYRDVTVERFDSSRLPDWDLFGLDRNESGGEYKPDSLYVEAAA